MRSEGLADLWDRGPEHAARVAEAREKGLFHIADRALSRNDPDDAAWDQMYRDGDDSLWSLGSPKKELVRVFKEARRAKTPSRLDAPVDPFSILPPAEGLLAVVLGSGRGVEVDYLARGADNATSAMVVAGIDFSITAIRHARKTFKSTPGAFFHASSVCDVPAPRSGPLDLIVDNTVYQNTRLSGGLSCYMKALRRFSAPGRTALIANFMSEDGVLARPGLKKILDDGGLTLPLNRREDILREFAPDWRLVWIKESIYDLDVEGCTACDAEGGIPSWSALFVRKRSPQLGRTPSMTRS